MIITFSVENFRSFDEEQTLDLNASGRYPGHHDSHIVTLGDSQTKVLPVSALYGANGAGKSNLFKALAYVERMVLRTRKAKSGTGRTPFMLSQEPRGLSCFDLQFSACGNIYRFGFKVDDEHVVEEWLIRVEGGRERVIFERATDPAGRVEVEYRGSEKMEALAKVGGLGHQTFLSTVRATLGEEDYDPDVATVIDWFRDTLVLIEPEAMYMDMAHKLEEDSAFLEFVNAFLGASSTGVSSLHVERKEVSEEQAEYFRSAKEGGEDSTSRPPVLVNFQERCEIRFDDSDDKPYLIRVLALHELSRGRVVNMKLSDESDGTQRLLDLIPALYRTQEKACVFVIDEIDRSMHPLLVLKFVESFLSCCRQSSHQLVFSTHDTNLLDLELLRRDEIWFVEKDDKGASRLHSLSDFKIRKDLEIRKHYIQGRFGAVPFLGQVDRLFSDETP
ncbi:MAG: AAA family ATPase [Pseudomonadota bacterium]